MSSFQSFKKFLLCYLLLFHLQWAYGAENTQVLRGIVLDQASQTPLIGASVQVQNENYSEGVSTNADGTFQLLLPLGRYRVTVSYVGYASYVQEAVLISSAKETYLKIGLIESDRNLGEVVIQSSQRQVTNESALLSARSFDPEELRRVPGGLDDPARMVRKFPGVSPNASITFNQINIRGNASRAVMWRLDDIDIYNPNHFGLLGGSGGSLTIFSQQLLTATDFYSGAFPADYGNALGGVFDVKFRDGNTTERQHSVQIGLLGIDLATEGPIGKKGRASYILNYRYSTTGIVDQFLQLGAIPTFQDLSFKINYQLNNSGQLNFFGIGGISDLSFTPALDTARWNDRPGSNFGRTNDSKTGTIGTSYLQPIGNKAYFKTVLIGTGISATQKRYYQNYDLVTADTTRLGDDRDFRISSHSYLNYKVGPKHTNRTGVVLHSLNSNVLFIQGNENDNQTNGALSDTVRYGSGSSSMLQAYTRSQFYLHDKWQINAGLHMMYLAFTGELSVEPRLGLRFQFTDRQSINLAYGLHSQMEPFFTYISEQYNPSARSFTRKNEDLGFNKAHHLNLAYYAQLTPKWRLGVELYYQKLFNLVTGVDLPIARVGGGDFRFESFDLDNGGSGENYGLEIAVERAFDKGYYLMANTSLFESNYTANDGVTRPSMFNAQYIVNLVGGKEWKLGQKAGKTNFLNLNLSFSASGPQYFTPLDLEESIARGYFMADFTRPNTLQQDGLLLADASLVWKRNKKKSSSEWVLQVSNLLNQRPLTGPVFDKENGEADLFYGNGIVPVISWRKNF